MELLQCPFCGGDAEHIITTERSGYGEYETTSHEHVVRCKKCGSRGRGFYQKHLIDFTRYTVSDFRSNPILRAKVEDDYEAYCKQTEQLSIDAWNTRADDEIRSK